MLSVALGCCREVFDAVLPLRCAACGKHGEQICATCLDKLSIQRLAYRAPTEISPAVFALGPYSGSLREVVHALKFRNRRSAAERLGEILGAGLLGLLDGRSRNAGPRIAGVDFVIPVPLHPQRQLERGYNQAEAIAAGVASKLSVPVLPTALVRWRKTHPQTSLGVHDRSTNVIDAFKPGPSLIVHQSRVLLVDDVVTTGATCAASAVALRSCGVASILAAALAIRV